MLTPVNAFKLSRIYENVTAPRFGEKKPSESVPEPAGVVSRRAVLGGLAALLATGVGGGVAYNLLNDSDSSSSRSTPSPTGGIQLGVDYTQGKDVRSMSGLLNGFAQRDDVTTPLPPPDVFNALQPQLWRTGEDINGQPGQMPHLPDMLASGAAIEFLLSEGYGYPLSIGDNWKPPNKNQSQWLQTVEGALRRYPELQDHYLEIWNEPDNSMIPWTGTDDDNARQAVDQRAAFWNGTYDDFIETYILTVRKLKEINPNIKVGGPSIRDFDSTLIRRFLDDCAENNVEVNFLAWHELGNIDDANDFSQIKRHLDEINQYLDENDYWNKLKLSEIHINEIVGRASTELPANTLASYYYAEEGGAARAARAGWESQIEEAETVRSYNNTLGGLLTPLSGHKKPVYEAIRAYAGISERNPENRGNLEFEENITRPSTTLDSGEPNIVVLGSPTYRPGNHRTLLVAYADAKGTKPVKDIDITLVDDSLPGQSVDAVSQSIFESEKNGDQRNRDYTPQELGTVHLPVQQSNGHKQVVVPLREVKPGEVRKVDILA